VEDVVDGGIVAVGVEAGEKRGHGPGRVGDQEAAQCVGYGREEVSGQYRSQGVRADAISCGAADRVISSALAAS